MRLTTLIKEGCLTVEKKNIAVVSTCPGLNDCLISTSYLAGLVTFSLTGLCVLVTFNQ